MVQPVGRLQAPGTEGQQAHAGDAIGQRVHLDHVTRQDEHAEHDGCEPDDPGEAIRAHPFSKKRLTLSAPALVTATKASARSVPARRRMSSSTADPKTISPAKSSPSRLKAASLESTTA